jgi:hypothetical protein
MPAEEIIKNFPEDKDKLNTKTWDGTSQPIFPEYKDPDSLQIYYEIYKYLVFLMNFKLLCKSDPHRRFLGGPLWRWE